MGSVPAECVDATLMLSSFELLLADVDIGSAESECAIDKQCDAVRGCLDRLRVGGRFLEGSLRMSEPCIDGLGERWIGWWDDPGYSIGEARTLHGAFAELLRTGPPGARRPANETAVEVVLGAFYALMLNWANLEGYPVRRRALAMARFLGDALAPVGRKKR